MNPEKRRKLRKAKRLKARRARGHKTPMKFWPIIYCPTEEMYIGVSFDGLKESLHKKRKVDESAWQEHNSQFLPGYKINMAQYEPGDKICCPNCGGAVDFRTFPSTTKPKLELPNRNDNQEAQSS